jgi:hypothetical protein
MADAAPDPRQSANEDEAGPSATAGSSWWSRRTRKQNRDFVVPFGAGVALLAVANLTGSIAPRVMGLGLMAIGVVAGFRTERRLDREKDAEVNRQRAESDARRRDWWKKNAPNSKRARRM